jgi:hypothetical protein
VFTPEGAVVDNVWKDWRDRGGCDSVGGLFGVITVMFRGVD